MFLWQEVHYYMVCIAYFTELKMQICDYKNHAFVAKIANTRLTERFLTIFALAERLPTSATLEVSNGMAGGEIN